MNWLANLLGIEAPENTTLRSAELGLRGGANVWLVALAFAAVFAFVAVTFLLYVTERGRLGPIRRIFLALVRITVLCFVLLLLLRPVLQLEYSGERPRGIALLLDDSKSMRQVDKRMNPPDLLRVAIARDLVKPDVSIRESSALLATLPAEDVKNVPRVELVKAVLANPRLKLLDGLKKHGPLRAYLFGEDLRSELEEKTPEGEKKDLVEQLHTRLTANQNKTALGDAIVKLLATGGDLPAGIVVVTDGLNNAGNTSLLEAAAECRQAQVPLYIYGVGSSEGGTLQLIDMAAAETIFYDDVVSVPIRWKAQGFKKGALEIKAWLGTKEVAHKEIPLVAGQDLRDTLTFTPRKQENFPKDNLELKVALQVKDNPQFQDTMKRPIRLSDSKVKVLYVENAPRWEYRFLQTVLLRDRRVKADFVLVQGNSELTKKPPFLKAFPTRTELLKYDLVILGDVPAAYLGKDRIEWVREFVRDFRGGLIVLSGRGHMPSSYAETVLAEVLPVEFHAAGLRSDNDQRVVAYQPRLTKAGETASMLQLADTPTESLKIWAELPGFFWHYPVTRLRPGATALLVHPHARMAEQPMPLMATQYYGKGQVVFLATDETWRWRKEAEDKHFTRFWGQLIYQLALPHLLGNASRRVQVTLERSEAVLDREGYIFVRLLDKDFRPLKAQEVPAELEYLDAPAGQERVEPVVFQAIAGRPGDYRLFRKHSQPGRFEVRFKLPEVDVNANFEYRVKLPPRHELEEAGLAEEALQQAALASGGYFYREENLHRLAGDIRAHGTDFTLHQEVLLWNPLVFLFFVGLITVEWVVRKFSNLS